jgi:dephospho-CoA kinase
MVILGLTGSIGMGKSVAARMFQREGAAVFDADDEVHQLLGVGGAAVDRVEAEFPDTIENTFGGRSISRQALARRVFGNDAAMDRLERILHPLVRHAEARFLARSAARGARLVVLEVPLLFETGGDKRCDSVAVVWAPAFVQAQRVYKRPGMTPEVLRAILSRQLPGKDKIQRAEFLILTGNGRAPTLRAVRHIVKMLSCREGRAWPQRPSS